LKDSVLRQISIRFAPEIHKIESDIEVCCYTSNGVSSIIEALSVAKALAPPDVNLKITVKACPIYSISLITEDPQKGAEIVLRIQRAVEEVVLKLGGKFQVKNPPKVDTNQPNLQL
jgi:translation initiation factor 2 alpha subunit (eIF-2alpha)